MTVDPAQEGGATPESWHAQAARYALLFDIVLTIASSKNLDSLLVQSVNKIKWVFDFDRCTLALRNGDDETYRLDTLLDTRRGSEPVRLKSVPLSDGLPGEVILTGQMQFFNDLQNSTGEISDVIDPATASGELGSLLAIPLEAYGRVIGSLSFSAKRTNCFSDEDVKIAVQFSTHLGLAIDRWQATEALQIAHLEAEASRTHLFEAIEAISDGFALFDAEDRLVMSNSVYKEYFSGISDMVTPGTVWKDFFSAGIERGVFQLDGVSPEAVLERAYLDRHDCRSIERRFSDGRWLQVSHHRTVDSGLVTIYADITELKQREAQLGELVDHLAQARDQAMEATRTKSQFLANMSHELRTPLNAVIGIAEMLHEDAEDDGLNDFIEPLERINNAGRHLLKLINDILDLSKIEAGKIEMLSEDFHVKSLLDEISIMVQPLAQKNGNTLTIDCAENVSQMRADSTRVRQIILNLLSNACKFTENGTVTVTVERRATATMDALSFTVADTGIGITDEQMARLFQEFSQADASTTRKYGGTGLGLTISQRLCELMGGNISVESEPNVGTTFTATLPVNVPDINLDGTVIYNAAEPILRAASDRGDLVLVIDDDVSVRELIKRHLTRDGFKVVTAKDGIEGLNLAREHNPAVITLDVLMPGADGWEVLRDLKADRALADIPVVMCTILDDKNKGYALGAADYLNKPVSRDNLRNVLGRYLSNPASAHVLVVDDDVSTRTMLRRLLVGEGCLVSEAGNGRLALEKLADGRPDLILLDLIMPEMDGFEFLAEFRTMESHADIPIVVITAADLSEQDHARLNGGVEKILHKSEFNRDDLLEVVLREVTRILGPSGHGDNS